MLWLWLACGNTDSDKTVECDSSASILHLENGFELPENACANLSLEARILGEGDFSVVVDRNRSWFSTHYHS